MLSNHNYEIDFLLSKRNKICPVEVKSSGYNTHKSLDVLMMPVYLVPFLK